MKDAARVRVTRDVLLDEAFVTRLYAQLPAGAHLRTAGELEASIDSMLAGHAEGEAVHVFAYGSLMWNPAFDHAGTRPATVHGWHRSFCLRSIIGRGSPEQPGLMLALDRGGACHGVLLCIEAQKARDELRVLWRREMMTGIYDARWVKARAGGMAVRAITFTANRAHTRYVRGLAVEEMARMINCGAGALGSSREYFDSVLDHLAALGVRDAGMERLRVAAGRR